MKTICKAGKEEQERPLKQKTFLFLFLRKREKICKPVRGDTETSLLQAASQSASSHHETLPSLLSADLFFAFK